MYFERGRPTISGAQQLFGEGQALYGGGKVGRGCGAGASGACHAAAVGAGGLGAGVAVAAGFVPGAGTSNGTIAGPALAFVLGPVDA